MKELMVILFSAILTQNFVLSKFMGICPFLGVSKKMNSAVGMSAAVTFVMVAASAITWPIYTYLLAPNTGIHPDHRPVRPAGGDSDQKVCQVPL